MRRRTLLLSITTAGIAGAGVFGWVSIPTWLQWSAGFFRNRHAAQEDDFHYGSTRQLRETRWDRQGRGLSRVGRQQL